MKSSKPPLGRNIGPNEPNRIKIIGTSRIDIARAALIFGFQGLQSLKIALAVEVYAPDKNAYQNISPDDSNRDIAIKLFQNIMDGLQDTLKILDFNVVDAAVDSLMQARRVDIYGFGNSATVCRDIETRFLRFGMMVHAYSDAHIQVTSASLLNEKDVVIAVSHTGASKDLLESVRVAQSRGAGILAITSYAQSPLARLADITLVGMGREIHYQSEAVASRLIHMAIADFLYMAIAMRMSNEYWENIRRMREVISKKNTLDRIRDEI